MKRTSHGVTFKLHKWSAGDVGLEVLICMALGVCAAAIVEYLR